MTRVENVIREFATKLMAVVRERRKAKVKAS